MLSKLSRAGIIVATGEEREPCRHLHPRASGFVLVEKAVLQGESVAERIARGKELLP